MKCITLTWQEMEIAAMVGVKRYLEVLRNHRQDRTGAPTDNEWQRHIIGALGEYAVGKALHVHWSIDTNWSKDLPDLIGDDPNGIEVRTTQRQDLPLVVQVSDPDCRRVVLVTAKPPSFWLRGFVMARDAKTREFEGVGRNGDRLYYVPQHALFSIDDDDLFPGQS